MRRRDFVAGAAALAAGYGAFPFPFRAGAQTAVLPNLDRMIDAHCHIFNAADIPIEGFARKIVLPQAAKSNQLVARFQEYPGALQAFVNALTIQVKAGAPSKQQEIATIDAFERDPRTKPTAAWRRAEDLRNLEATLRIIWGNKDMFRGIKFSDVLALEVALENLQLFLVQLVYSEFGEPELTAEERVLLRQWPLDTLARQLYPRQDLVGRYIRWVLLFTRYRYELAEELAQLHGRTADSPRIALMTPAIVDFGKWLEDEDHIQIEQQAEIMSRIARRRTGPRVHCFIAFDPLRQALYDRGRHKQGEKDPMVILRNAIEVRTAGGTSGTTGGGIGVKLYPPMGFQAIGNASLSDVPGFIDPVYLRSADTGLGPRVGSRLDAALSKLYAWCSAHNVPVMAHANDSFGPSPEYEKRAHPKFWQRVLEPQAFPNLRINMAHFGHFNAAVRHKNPGSQIKNCWEWTVGEILSDEKNPYAYADISSLSEILQVAPSRKILACMIAFREAFPPSVIDRLIYGSDWSMIAQSEGFPRVNARRPYPDLMVAFLRAAGYSDAQIEGIMFRNASRFLGLSKSERELYGPNCTRSRLEAFYAAHQLNADWMNAFD